MSSFTTLPQHEYVSNACIEYDFGWHSRIKASKYHGCRILPAALDRF